MRAYLAALMVREMLVGFAPTVATGTTSSYYYGKQFDRRRAIERIKAQRHQQMLIVGKTLIFVAIMLSLLPRFVSAHEQDLSILLNDVKQIASPGIPGNICVFGSNAFAIVQDRQKTGAGSPVVTAARFGEGRVVLFGHTGYFDVGTLETADTGQLMLNAVRWVAGGRSDPQVGVVRRAELATYLRNNGLNASDVSLADLSSINVLLIAIDHISSDELAALTTFIKDGGGLISVATGWGWAQLNPGKDLRKDFSANQLFAPMGLVFADGMTRDTVQDGFATDKTPSPQTNASVALESFRQNLDDEQVLNDQELAQISATLALAMHSIPSDDLIFLPHLRKMMKERHVDPIPSPEHPVTSKDILERLALTQQIHASEELPPEQVEAHPSAAIFPGASPDGTTTAIRIVAIDTRISGWHSTGLYADPGSLIAVEMPEDATDKGLKIRIGSTTCRNWSHAKWIRAPEVTREFPLTEAESRAASAFGGLVYIVVPEGCEPGTVSVTIRNGVEAPYYILGKTNLEEWRSTIRHLPAPWAELASDKAILTVPSQEIRELDDPESLMKLWDRILDLCAELAAWPSPERQRPQRYVADVQLCAGYMHAGHPIMIPTSTAGKLVDRDHLLHEGNWGFFHETGHNHQERDWTFGGTGEVTVNLFTMYLFDKLCGIKPENGRMAQDGIRRQYVQYFENGPDFNQWKRKPFLALYMYYQLQQAFGWDAYERIFAEYRDLPDEERPKDDDQKRDQWLVRFSRTVGKDLGPFFQAWGIPVSDPALESVKDLPAWMPDDFPPKKAG